MLTEMVVQLPRLPTGNAASTAITMLPPITYNDNLNTLQNNGLVRYAAPSAQQQRLRCEYPNAVFLIPRFSCLYT
jgi:hypothetical protein